MRKLLASILLCAASALALPLGWELRWPKSADPRIIGYRIYALRGTNWLMWGETTNNWFSINPGCYAVTSLAVSNESAIGETICTLDALTNLSITATLNIVVTNK